MEKVKFEDLALSRDTRQAIADMNFTEASPIQAQAIPVILQGNDVIGQAQTGTGKTAAFGIPLVEMVDSGSKAVEALIMCPTRELAIQVANELKKLAKYKKGLFIVPIYGGEQIQKQINAMKRGVQVVVGTPGRVIDHLERKTFNFNNTKMVVLDEADEMLNMGFRDDIEHILKMMPAERQTVLFSATMPKPILDLTKRFQKDPKLIKVTKNELTVSLIEQIYFEAGESRKVEMISGLIDQYNLQLMLVFCNTKRKVDEVVEKFNNMGIRAEGIHGDLRQHQRNQVLSKFRNAQVNVLVATDVAARGIDVSNVDAVFNYDIPHDAEYYIHRIGRTGRAGKSGKAFSFVSGKGDLRSLKEIQSYTKVSITKGHVPTAKEKAEMNKERLLIRIKEIIAAPEIKNFEAIANEMCRKGEYSMDQLAAALLKILGKSEAAEKRQQVAKSNDVLIDKRPEKDEKKSKVSHKKNKQMVRLFINMGKKDKVGAKDIADVLAHMADTDSRKIGDIDLYDKFCFAEIPEEFLEKVFRNMNDISMKGKTLNIEIAKD